MIMKWEPAPYFTNEEYKARFEQWVGEHNFNQRSVKEDMELSSKIQTMLHNNEITIGDAIKKIHDRT